MPKMTSKERLLAAIKFEGPDRVPLSPGLQQLSKKKYNKLDLPHFIKISEEYGADSMFGLGINPNCFDSPAFDYSVLKNVKVDVQASEDKEGIFYRRKFETPAGLLTDLIMKPTAAEYGFSPMTCIKECLIKERADVDKIPFLFYPAELLKRDASIREKQKEIGERGLGYYMIRGALDCRAGYCREIADMMVDYYNDYDFFKKQVLIHHKHSVEMLKAAVEAGAEVIDGSWYFTGISAGWSPEIIRKEFMPLIEEHAEVAKSCGVLYMIYDDGKVMQILEMLKETGIKLLETCAPFPGGDFELKRAREIAGRKYAFKGGLDQIHDILKGTPELIEQKVKACLAAADRAGGFILSTGDPILLETPEENVKAVFEAGRKYGLLKK